MPRTAHPPAPCRRPSAAPGRRLAAAALLLTPIHLIGCAATAPVDEPPAGPRLLSADVARAAPIIRGDGTPATWSDLLDAAAAAEAVLLGEQHGHELGLSVAAALWRDLLARSPRAALALEFIERDEQSRLDDFLAGLTDESVFIRRTGRTSSGAQGGNYPAAHRDMVLAAREAGRPVFAANAPRAYVRLARRQGLDALDRLTPEQRRLVRRPDLLPTGRYREAFFRLMGLDAASPEAPDPARRAEVEGLFIAQSVWDWTMADTLATALAAGHAPVVLVVGQFHSDHDGGLPQALRHIRPETRMLTVSFQPDAPANDPTGSSPHIGRADFVVLTGASTPARTRAVPTGHPH